MEHEPPVPQHQGGDLPARVRVLEARVELLMEFASTVLGYGTASAGRIPPAAMSRAWGAGRRTSVQVDIDGREWNVGIPQDADPACLPETWQAIRAAITAGRTG